MPSAPDFGAVAAQYLDPAVTQLQANVLHLQSQLMMAKSVLQLKNATIEAKDALIDALKEKVDLRTVLPNRATVLEPEDSEPLVGELVSVKRHSFKFLEVNFPEILRKLKRIRPDKR